MIAQQQKQTPTTGGLQSEQPILPTNGSPFTQEISKSLKKANNATSINAQAQIGTSPAMGLASNFQKQPHRRKILFEYGLDKKITQQNQVNTINTQAPLGGIGAGIGGGIGSFNYQQNINSVSFKPQATAGVTVNGLAAMIGLSDNNLFSNNHNGPSISLQNHIANLQQDSLNSSAAPQNGQQQVVARVVRYGAPPLESLGAVKGSSLGYYSKIQSSTNPSTIEGGQSNGLSGLNSMNGIGGISGIGGLGFQNGQNHSLNNNIFGQKQQILAQNQTNINSQQTVAVNSNTASKVQGSFVVAPTSTSISALNRGGLYDQKQPIQNTENISPAISGNINYPQYVQQANHNQRTNSSLPNRFFPNQPMSASAALGGTNASQVITEPDNQKQQENYYSNSNKRVSVPTTQNGVQSQINNIISYGNYYGSPQTGNQQAQNSQGNNQAINQTKQQVPSPYQNNSATGQNLFDELLANSKANKSFEKQMVQNGGNKNRKQKWNNLKEKNWSIFWIKYLLQSDLLEAKELEQLRQLTNQYEFNLEEYQNAQKQTILNGQFEVQETISNNYQYYLDLSTNINNHKQ